MNKMKITNRMAEILGVQKKEAKRALEAFVQATEEAVRERKKITLVGLWSIDFRLRKAHTGTNPATGEKVKVKAKTILKIKPGKKLAEAAAGIAEPTS